MTENLFGENLKSLREMNHLNRKDLAEKLDVSVQSIHYYETGKRETNFATLIKIADLFAVSIDSLLRGNPDDFGKSEKIQLSRSRNEISAKIPVGKQDLFLEALPYAADVINAVMEAVKGVNITGKTHSFTFTFSREENTQE